LSEHEEDYKVSFEEETKVIRIKNEEILIKLLYLSNAVIIFITERPVAIGTICLATPAISLGGLGRGESLALFGGRFDLFARAIAEKISAETGKIVLASVALNEKFLEDQYNLSKIIKAILEIEATR